MLHGNVIYLFLFVVRSVFSSLFCFFVFIFFQLYLCVRYIVRFSESFFVFICHPSRKRIILHSTFNPYNTSNSETKKIILLWNIRVFYRCYSTITSDETVNYCEFIIGCVSVYVLLQSKSSGYRYNSFFFFSSFY